MNFFLSKTLSKNFLLNRFKGEGLDFNKISDL